MAISEVQGKPCQLELKFNGTGEKVATLKQDHTEAIHDLQNADEHGAEGPEKRGGGRSYTAKPVEVQYKATKAGPEVHATLAQTKPDRRAMPKKLRRRTTMYEGHTARVHGRAQQSKTGSQRWSCWAIGSSRGESGLGGSPRHRSTAIQPPEGGKGSRKQAASVLQRM